MAMFTVVTTLSSIGFIFVWAIILLAYLKYRKTRPHLHEKSIYKLPGGTAMVWVCLAFLAFVLVLFSRDADTRLGLMCLHRAVLGTVCAQTQPCPNPTAVAAIAAEKIQGYLKVVAQTKLK